MVRKDDSAPVAHITGMRRGEIAAMRLDHTNIKARVLLVSETKTGDPRQVPLPSRALAVLNTCHADWMVYDMGDHPRGPHITGICPRLQARRHRGLKLP
ncbi:tyrosine-type recombinase/integrase [Acidithiobacillus sp. MC6.1]|nr:tyrosine-type recombinase/integrase [Acidithiobacillus sp. MC6.1]